MYSAGVAVTTFAAANIYFKLFPQSARNKRLVLFGGKQKK